MKASEHHPRITRRKYLNHAIISFQHLQSSKHCKAYTDEEDSVLLSESLKFCSKDMTMLQEERVSWQESGHGCAKRMDIMSVRRGRGRRLWASLSRILIGGNGKDRRRQNISGRGNYLIKCTEGKYF